MILQEIFNNNFEILIPEFFLTTILLILLLPIIYMGISSTFLINLIEPSIMNLASIIKVKLDSVSV